MAERKPSPTMAMHKRYEETMAEYRVVENAEREARDGKDETDALLLGNALKDLTRETDAVRVAILHQVPDSWAEAMVLQFHIVAAHDLHASCATAPDGEVEVVQTAIETLFDFMCCEIDQNHAALGDAFQTEANRVFFKRRRRTGVVEL
jgi:hypothetical protein